MKRSFPGMSVVAATLVAASTAFAGGLNLAWNNCLSEGTTGASNRTSACLTNAGVNTLTGSFVPDADIAGVTGVEMVLDLIAGDGTSTIPSWWDLGNGNCRPISLATSGVDLNNVVCTDWALEQGNGGVAAYNGGGTIAPANLPAHRRIIIAFAVAATSAQNLTATTEYWAFNATVNNAKTVGLGACAGCGTPVCIVFNSTSIVPGTAQNQFVGAGTSAGSNFVTWQGTGPSCALVPTRNTTWGQVKSLYR